jgi:hypothetical protein
MHENEFRFRSRVGAASNGRPIVDEKLPGSFTSSTPGLDRGGTHRTECATSAGRASTTTPHVTNVNEGPAVLLEQPGCEGQTREASASHNRRESQILLEPHTEALSVSESVDSMYRSNGSHKLYFAISNGEQSANTTVIETREIRSDSVRTGQFPHSLINTICIDRAANEQWPPSAHKHNRFV